MENINIKLPNFEQLKKEIILNWDKLEGMGYNRLGNPYWIKIYDLLDIKTDLVELEIAKEYLKKFDLDKFQLIVYLPYARTGFHIDGYVHRYILPIVSSENAFNFELDSKLLNDSYKKVIERYNDAIGFGNIPTLYESNNFDWLDTYKYDNKVFVVKENQCIKIGDNWHAHMNNHYQHRIVIVFDSKKNIVIND